MKETKSNYCEHCGGFHDPVRDYTSQVKVGEVVPDFEFEAYQKDEIKKLSLSTLRGKWVVLVFYPADFTFICPTELEELAKLYPKFVEANAFGVLIEGGEPELTPDEGLALRGTFIIDPSGILRAMEINDNSMGRKAAETLRKLQAAQFVETHKGHVCPASWEPGDDTLEPGLDLVGKL